MEFIARGLVVVTGGGSGIGRAVALRQAAAGDEVLVVGRRLGALQQTAEQDPEGRIRTLAADLTTPDGGEALGAAVDGDVAGIVCAAGGQGDFYRPGTGLAEIHQAWQAALRLNLTTALLTVEPLVPRLLDQRGRIVLISSTAALDGAGGPYATAKAALHGYGRELAVRLGPRGITSNIVAPGFIADTEFFDNGFAGDGFDPDAARDHAARTSPVGRAGTPGDIAAAVAWLFSPEGGFTTGQVISPNGGTVGVR